MIRLIEHNGHIALFVTKGLNEEDINMFNVVLSAETKLSNVMYCNKFIASFNKDGTKQCSHQQVCKWHFVNAYNATLITLMALKPIIGRDVARMISKLLFNSRHDYKVWLK